MQVNITIPQAFSELFTPSRYKAYYGGRGSGKTENFASALLIKAMQQPLRVLCTRELQKSIKDSVKRTLDDQILKYGLGKFFTSVESEIRGSNGSLFLFAGLKSNPESIKSMQGIDVCWAEESSTLSQRSIDLLVPTIRKENSEIWFSWNPDNEHDPVDKMFRGVTPPSNAIIRNVNWDDNPFFPEVLKEELEHDLRTNKLKYNHVWLGGYNEVREGAYYAENIAQANSENRITKVYHSPYAQVYSSFDLGIGDDTSVWIYQFIGQEIHFLEFIENRGVGIEWYAQELRKRGYDYAPLVLPHDARARQLGTGKSIEEVLISLGFQTDICPMIPVKDGIEAVRREMNRCWFDVDLCKAGLNHLRNYRENYDDKLRISRGALHDEHSHCADSLRYAIIAMQERKSSVVSAQKNYLQQLRMQKR